MVIRIQGAKFTMDDTKLKFNTLFVDRLNVQVFCKNSFFSNMYKLNSACDLVSQHNGLFSGYIMYIVRYDCHKAIYLKHPKFLGNAYSSWIT